MSCTDLSCTDDGAGCSADADTSCCGAGCSADDADTSCCGAGCSADDAGSCSYSSFGINCLCISASIIVAMSFIKV
jgi:hypothetical protein